MGSGEGSPASILGADLKKSKSEPQNAILQHQEVIERSKVCSTSECIATATDVLEKMDSTIDPCEDFYEFACGRFLNKTKISNPDSSVSVITTITDDIKNKLKMVITEPEYREDTKHFIMVKQFYTSCMDTDRINEIGVEPMKEALKKLGRWPVLEKEWDEESFDWKESVYKLRQEGFQFNFLLDFSISADLENSIKRRIYIDQANLIIMFKGDDINESSLDSYHQSMVNIAVEFGAEKKSASEDLRKSMKFELDLAKISDPSDGREDSKTYNPMTICEAQQEFPSIPWLEYINNILTPTNKVKTDEVLVIKAPNYVRKLEKLLNTTSKRTLANYLMWRAVDSSVYYLADNLQNYLLKFNKRLKKSTENESRKKTCIEETAKSFPIAISSLYVKNFVREGVKETVLEMADNILEEMYKIVKSARWMKSKTRKNAKNKVKAMLTHIAYPDEFLDDQIIEEYYSEIELPENDYFDSFLTVNKFNYYKSYSELHQPIDKNDWITPSTLTEVNAHYDRSENRIDVPAGILQGAFFSLDRPQYMNYGGIGFVIGHEINHGFDNEGRLYDKNGNLDDWWDSKSERKYLERVQCIIDQYSSYTVEEVGMNINGTKTQGENVADNGGIVAAYEAYISWTKKHRDEPRLPGLQDYSPRQMFWLSTAQSWCTKSGPEAMKYQLTDVHSPAAFRIIGTFSNRKEFAKDFDCRRRSEMNPKEKCELWED